MMLAKNACGRLCAGIMVDNECAHSKFPSEASMAQAYSSAPTHQASALVNGFVVVVGDYCRRIPSAVFLEFHRQLQCTCRYTLLTNKHFSLITGFHINNYICIVYESSSISHIQFYHIAHCCCCLSAEPESYKQPQTI